MADGGKGVWYLMFLREWHDMWWDRAQSRLDLDMAVGGAQPSRQIPEAPQMVQPEDGELLEVHSRVVRRCSQEYHPRAYTPDVDHPPKNYTRWVARLIGHSSFYPVPNVSFLGTPIRHTQPFALMSDSTPTSTYEAPH
ncbi:hypothetical protein PIB30_019036 [Stylosanthes scabra]|uniref:Uncharacterized protein n=1 Tax=Stylosanthes scabra TaxID=79078 RepID=A0ABU6S7Y7_9FABA|nr:hypothetical protein [Stylosanthes scabra]